MRKSLLVLFLFLFSGISSAFADSYVASGVFQFGAYRPNMSYGATMFYPTDLGWQSNLTDTMTIVPLTADIDRVTLHLNYYLPTVYLVDYIFNKSTLKGTQIGYISAPCTVSGLILTCGSNHYAVTDFTGSSLPNPLWPDTTPPVITLLWSSTVHVNHGATYTDSGATADDGIYGDFTSSIITTGLPVDTSTDGTYTITYDVTDASGNSATQVTRTVIVSSPSSGLSFTGTIATMGVWTVGSTTGVLGGSVGQIIFGLLALAILALLAYKYRHIFGFNKQ